MKIKLLKKIFITGTLCAAITIPSIQGVRANDVAPKQLVAVPISYKLHWSQPFVDKLIEEYKVEEFFKEKDLSEVIKAEEFAELVKLTIDSGYVGEVESVSRETIIQEATKIWADNTNNNLDEIAIIKMIIYSDTTDIDAKYMHGVYVAYMKDIAKGKGNQRFDPKAEITYGELATLLCNTDAAIQKELEKTNPIMKGRYETRVAYEILEDKVVFDFELISHYTKDTTLMFGSGQSFDLVITDEKGNEVYRFADGKAFIQMIREQTLGAGEVIKFQDSWDMTDKEGNKLTSGKFTAEIRILAVPTEEEQIKEQFTQSLEFQLGE